MTDTLDEGAKTELPRFLSRSQAGSLVQRFREHLLELGSIREAAATASRGEAVRQESDRFRGGCDERARAATGDVCIGGMEGKARSPK